MAYTPLYTTADFQSMIIDFMGTVLSVLIQNIALVIFLVIITVVIVRWGGAIRALLGSIRF